VQLKPSQALQNRGSWKRSNRYKEKLGFNYKLKVSPASDWLDQSIVLTRLYGRRLLGLS
jgi:hypothetical protein